MSAEAQDHFVERCAAHPDTAHHVLFTDDRVVRVGVARGRDLLEAFMAIQQLGSALAGEVAATQLTSATLEGDRDQYLFRTLPFAEGDLHTVFRARSEIALDDAVNRIHRETVLAETEWARIGSLPPSPSVSRSVEVPVVRSGSGTPSNRPDDQPADVQPADDGGDDGGDDGRWGVYRGVRYRLD